VTKIFVFGSNARGIHGAGAAKEARWKHGAVWGVAEGLQGNAYGIATKDHGLKPRTLEDIQASVETFLTFARDVEETGMLFQVTRIGCGLAGFTDAQIGPMFAGAPANCELPVNWEQYRGAERLLAPSITPELEAVHKKR
jgi:hypothetical protein